MDHQVIVLIHLLCAVLFVGAVAMEVLILEPVRKVIGDEVFQRVEFYLFRRIRRTYPLAVIPLYVTGLLGYAWLCLRPLLADLADRPGPLAGLYRKLAYGGHDNPSAIKAAAMIAPLGALLVLFQMTGRGIEDEQQLCTGSMSHLGRTGLPDIGADIDAAPHATQRDDAGFSAGLKIALFVKNFVIG